MPRTVDAGMQSDLDEEVTTLAHIWSIERRDGVTYRYTNHDRHLEVPAGSGIIYYSQHAQPNSSIEFRINLSVNNLEVVGFLDTLQISEADLIARRFYRADVRFYVVNWLNTSRPPVKTIRGWTGDITREGDRYTAEVRSLAQGLQETVGCLISERCRVITFGSTGFGCDDGCNYPVSPDAWEPYREYGTQPVGSGAQIIALPNGGGDWDGGAPANGTVQIVNGGMGYSDNLQISAYWVFDWGERVKWDATSYTVSNGVLTDVFFPLTSDGAKPGHTAVSIVVIDVGAVSTTHIKPTVRNGFNYRLVVPGMSDNFEPTWSTVLGGITIDGTAQWETVIASDYLANVTFSANRSTITGNGIIGDITYETAVTGTGAILTALPNGHGLWDGGDTPSNVQIINGGLNYVNPTVTALFVHPITGNPVEWVATIVGLSQEGKITYVKFDPTVENEKPNSSQVTFVIDDSPIDDTSPGGFFDSGTVTFLSGENLGIEIDIKTFTDFGLGFFELELYSPAPFDIAYSLSNSDTILLKIGCDRRWQTCKNRYRNQLNFRGEPGIPGDGVLFRINTNI